MYRGKQTHARNKRNGTMIVGKFKQVRTRPNQFWVAPNPKLDSRFGKVWVRTEVQNRTAAALEY